MRLLITGASGLLGAYLLREAAGLDNVMAWGGPGVGKSQDFAMRSIDLTDASAVAAAFRLDRPDVIIHSAALARVADCWRDPERARRINVTATENLGNLAADAGARLVFVSTDLVFDGENAPYREDATPDPVSIYGKTKRAAEEAVLAVPRSAVVRVSLLYGPARNGRASFFDEQVAALRSGRKVTLFRDEWRTPLDLSTAARALVAIALSDFNGILHIGGPERLSRLEMGMRLAKSLGFDTAPIVATDRNAVAAPEPRPRDVALDSSRWRSLFPAVRWPTWDQVLDELL